MDVARPPKSKRNRYLIGAAALVAVVAASVALTRLEPAAPGVERSTLWIDSVVRGTMVRQVRAPGTLVPEQIRWVSAVTAGRVERLAVRAGTRVSRNQVILELSNPDVQLQALEAERQLTGAEAELVNLRSALESQRLNQQATVATVTTELREAQRIVETQSALDKKGLSSTMEVQRAADKAEELGARQTIEQSRLRIYTEATQQQYALQRAQVGRLRSIAQFHRNRVQSMNVLAGEDGVLQELPLELGQWVTPGQILAKVAQPGRLKAVLRVPETQAKDVVIGQPVSVDTRNGIAPGRVMRIDPAAQNGTVTVEVALEGDLPKGARAELSVDGTIEIERLTDVLHVARPAYGQAESVVGLFKLTPDEKSATRVNVKLGRGSVNTIEVVQGLNVGDKVIVSDVSQWDSQSRLRIK